MCHSVLIYSHQRIYKKSENRDLCDEHSKKLKNFLLLMYLDVNLVYI